MTMAEHDSSARWRTFLTEAKEDQILLLMSKQAPPYLEIPFHELQAGDPEFADQVLEYPRRILDQGSRTLIEICRERGEDIEAVLRIGELPRDSRTKIRDIGRLELGKLRSIEAIVTKISEIKPRLLHAVFICESCEHVIEVTQKDERELMQPLRCPPTTGCGAYPGRSKDATRFHLVMEQSRLTNNQWIEIQELPEHVPSGAQPSRGTVLLEGDLVNQNLPGQRITANVIPFVLQEVKGSKKTPMFDILYRLISSEQENTPFTEIQISQEDKDQIIEISKREDLLGMMQHSIAPSVIAADNRMQYVKRSLVLQLFGGVSRRNSDLTRSRGEIHILLMGDPGVAKSQLLTYMSSLSPRGKYTSGGGTSAAGLTAAVIRDAFGDGRFAIEAGVLPLSDRGLAAIDEFDKMNKEDRGSMHAAMEQGFVHIAKAGLTASLPARCAVLAAANPKFGRFVGNPNDSVMYYFDQVDLPLPLASRFDIIWFLRDEINIITDEKIASHILDVRTEGISETELESGFSFDPFDEDEEIIQVDVNNKEHFSNSFLRKYIAYAKLNIHPRLDKGAKSLILDYYTQMRQKFSKDSAFNPNTPGTGRPEADAKVVPITPRSLESLIRISEAHARMHLRDTATAVDAKVAIAVYAHWREESNIEDESALFSSVSTVERTSPRVVREIVRDICSERTVAKLHDIYSRASVHKITERMVDEALSKMRMNGELFSPRNDEYSFAR